MSQPPLSEEQRVGVAATDMHLRGCDQDAGAFVQRFTDAKAGSAEAMGDLLQNCRNYLLLIANVAMQRGLQAKVGASDLVQETFVEAQRIFDRFEGRSEEELLRWLSKILEHKVGNTLKRYYGAACRNVNQELDWQQLSDSVLGANGVAAAVHESPSGVLINKENHEKYQQILASLPSEHQDVIRLRIDESLSFEEIGRRMERSADAARKLFARAIIRMQAQQNPSHDSAPESDRASSSHRAV